MDTGSTQLVPANTRRTRFARPAPAAERVSTKAQRAGTATRRTECARPARPASILAQVLRRVPIAQLANMLPQLAAMRLPTALLVTLGGTELEQGRIHSAQARVPLVDTHWRKLLLARLLKIALFATLGVMVL